MIRWCFTYTIIISAPYIVLDRYFDAPLLHQIGLLGITAVEVFIIAIAKKHLIDRALTAARRRREEWSAGREGSSRQH